MILLSKSRETEGWEIKGSTITTARTNAGESIVDFENQNDLYVVDKDGNKKSQ